VSPSVFRAFPYVKWKRKLDKILMLQQEWSRFLFNKKYKIYFEIHIWHEINTICTFVYVVDVKERWGWWNIFKCLTVCWEKVECSMQRFINISLTLCPEMHRFAVLISFSHMYQNNKNNKSNRTITCENKKNIKQTKQNEYRIKTWTPYWIVDHKYVIN